MPRAKTACQYPTRVHASLPALPERSALPAPLSILKLYAADVFVFTVFVLTAERRTPIMLVKVFTKNRAQSKARAGVIVTKVPKVSEATVSRLPLYVDCLARLANQGTRVVSSEELAKLAGVKAAQLRKDLSYLGGFGVRGLGYEVQLLLRQIAKYLGLTHRWLVAIVGFGKLGSALANYGGFAERNYHVVAAFDIDPAKFGLPAGEGQVYSLSDMERVLREKDVDLAIVTTPASAAQATVDRLVLAGVRSILNFAPVPLIVPEGINLREVDLGTELQILSFYETLQGVSLSRSSRASRLRTRGSGLGRRGRPRKAAVVAADADLDPAIC